TNSFRPGNTLEIGYSIGYSEVIMAKRRLAGVALSIFLALVGIEAQTRRGGAAEINPTALRQWLTYISSDDLEGRETFSEGLGLAAAYIADQLKSAGVRPGGDH